ncbi:MAG TPA: SgcJ/EcaC family oxidoreductase [Chitinophagaceae bacterium]|nr:SgcJ/EcaC family oxidoreductase [Chitinophagaceae bacterium]
MRTNKDDGNNIRSLYEKLLESWNDNNAGKFSKLFADDGNVIGFDGSQMNGRNQINDELNKVFVNHKVSSYVGIVREIRTLSPTVFLLRAVAGMVPQDKAEIKADMNTIQTLVGQREHDEFLITLYQNTPAAFHGRPELVKQLTEELQKVVNGKQTIR